jgi:hypothetical protein
MKYFCNIIPEFCSPDVQKKILHFYENLEKQGLIPDILNLKLDYYDLKSNNLFFISLNKDTEFHLQDLMNKMDCKTTRIVIITSEEENYFDFAIEHNICNIIHVKRLNESLLLGILNCFLKENLNLESFFENKKKIIDKYYCLSGNISMLKLIENTFADFIEEMRSEIRNTFIINCHELVTNAIAYGVLGITAYARDKKERDTTHYTSINIPQNKKIKVRLLMGEDLYGISVKDSCGLLTIQRILERIRRQSVVAGETIPQGIEDYTGRGLAILCHLGILIFSIKPGEFTEVSLISNLEASFEKKPISILAAEI